MSSNLFELEKAINSLDELLKKLDTTEQKSYSPNSIDKFYKLTTAIKKHLPHKKRTFLNSDYSKSPQNISNYSPLKVEEVFLKNDFKQINISYSKKQLTEMYISIHNFKPSSSITKQQLIGDINLSITGKIRAKNIMNIKL